MSELEDKIAEVLRDPEQMAQISRLAQSLMGGEGAPSSAAPAEAAAGAAVGGKLDALDLGALGIDGAVLARVMRALNATGGGNMPQQALLDAMRPYLSEKRQGKLERAVKIARLARLARFALADGEDGKNA